MINIRLMKKILLIGLFGLLLSACYRDNMEDLFPDSGGPCDTTNVSFSQSLMPVLDTYCTGCHSGSAPSGNISIENYDDVVILVQNGKLMGTIRHEKGYSPMPKGEYKLSACNIAKIEKWISDGMPDN